MVKTKDKDSDDKADEDNGDNDDNDDKDDGDGHQPLYLVPVEGEGVHRVKTDWSIILNDRSS